MKIAWWKIGFVMLAPVLVGCVLFVFAKDMNAKEWLETAFPTWLQGLGTVFAAGFAFFAFQEWQTQERAKKKADAAERILHAAYDTSISVQDARHVVELPMDDRNLDDEEMLRSLVDVGIEVTKKAQLEGGAEAAGRLRTYGLIGKLYFGPEVERLTNDIYEARAAVINALDALESKKTGRDALAALYGKDEALADLALLGLHTTTNGIAENGKDSMGNRLERNLTELGNVLKVHLLYGDGKRK